MRHHRFLEREFEDLRIRLWIPILNVLLYVIQKKIYSYIYNNIAKTLLYLLIYILLSINSFCRRYS